MVENTTKAAEESYLKLKAQASEDEWNHPQYVKQLAIDVSHTDILLSYRLIQRAKVLKSDGPDINRLYNQYRLVAKAQFPEMFEPERSQKVVSIGASSETETAETTVKRSSILSFFLKPLMVLVVLPWLIFAIYLLFIASPRFESKMQLIVQQPDSMATMDASMAILSGLGVSSGNTDPQLVKAYVYSNDMLQYLQEHLGVKEHFSQQSVDWFSRLSSDSTQEEGFKFFQNQVQVDIDESSQIVTIYVRAFEPEYAFQLSKAIAQRAEWYINSIGHQLANAQLEFIQGEHDLVEKRLQKAKQNLLSFQQKYNLLDPEAEGAALSQIAYAIEGQLATAQAELRALESNMSSQAPQVVMAKAKLDSLYEQLAIERERLTVQRGINIEGANSDGLSVSQLLARFTGYKIELELALSAYTSSQVSLEKSRIEAYRQIKYLIGVEAPTKPEDNRYPKVSYNLTLAAAVLLMLFGIGNILVATIRELN
ncbi:lipopolysaccharide biosynthesis protein [Agarivorans sp. MS3-6]